jgi:hypothetical protein
MADAIASPDFSFGATFIIERPLEKRVGRRRGEVGGLVAMMAVATDAYDGPEEEDVGINIARWSECGCLMR